MFSIAGVVIKFLPPVTPQIHLPTSLGAGTHGASHLLHRRTPAVAETINRLPLLRGCTGGLVPPFAGQLAATTVRGDAVAAADVQASTGVMLDRQAGEVVAGGAGAVVDRGPVVGEEVLDLHVVRVRGGVRRRRGLHLGVVGGCVVVVRVRVHVRHGGPGVVVVSAERRRRHGQVPASIRALAGAPFAAADLEEALLLEHAAHHPSVLLHTDN